MIARRSALTFGVQLLSLLASVAITVLVTRATGAPGKGLYTLVALVVSITTLASGLGVSWASIYHIGKRTFSLAEQTGTLLTASSMSAVVALAAEAAAFALFRNTYFHALNQTQIGLALFITPVAQLTTAFGSILLGLNRVVQYSLVNMLQLFVTLVVQVALAIAQHLTATTAVAAWATGSAVALITMGTLVARQTRVRPHFNVQVLRSYIAYGVKGYVANVMTLLNYRLDSLIVNGLIGVTQLGIYSIAVALAELLWYAANSISLVMFPHVSSLSREEANRVTPAVARNTLFITLVGAVGMFVLGRWVILIVFGPVMLPAVLPLWLLLPGIVTLSAGKVIASYLSGIGRPIYATYISGATLVLTVILDIVLIPRFGIAGAAAASSIVYTCASALSILVFIRESGRGWAETLVVRPEDFRQYVKLYFSVRSRLTGLATARDPIA